MEKQALLELRSVGREYQSKNGKRLAALSDVSLMLPARGMVFVVGKSGCGKTTLLNLLGGLDTPDSGEILFAGKSMQSFREKERNAYRNTCVGFVFQENNLIETMRVRDNVALACQLQGRRTDRAQVRKALARVGLESCIDRKASELSGGQKQRVAIARAWIKNPKMILADEPTGALDVQTGKEVLDVLKQLSEQCLVVVVSHDRAFASEYADRVIEISDGRVVSDTLTVGEVQQEAQQSDIEQIEPMRAGHLPYRRNLSMGIKAAWHKKFRLIVMILLCVVSFGAFGIADAMTVFDPIVLTAQAWQTSGEDSITYQASAKDIKREGYQTPLNGSSRQDLQRLREQTGLDFQGALQGAVLQVPEPELLDNGTEAQYYSARYSMLSADADLFADQKYELYGRMPQSDREIVITRYLCEQYSIAGIDDEMAPSELPFPDSSEAIEQILVENITLYLKGVRCRVVGIVDTHADPTGKFEWLKPQNHPTIPKSQEYDWRKQVLNHFEYGYHSVIFLHADAYAAMVAEKTRTDVAGFGRAISSTIVGKGWSVELEGAAPDAALTHAEEIVWLDGKGDRKQLAPHEIVIGIEAAYDLWPMDAEYEMKVPYKMEGTYMDGMVTFRNLSLLDFRTDVCPFLAYYEVAKQLSQAQLEQYREHCISIGYVPQLKDARYLDQKANPTYEIVYDPQTMTEQEWRLSYACYLSDSSFLTDIGYIEGGYSYNAIGLERGQTIARHDGERIFAQERLRNAIGAMQKDIPRDYAVSLEGAVMWNFPEVEFGEHPQIVGVYMPKQGYPSNYVINNVLYQATEGLEQEIYAYMIAPLPQDQAQIEQLAKIHYDMLQSRGFQSVNNVVHATQSLYYPFRTIMPYLQIGSAVLGVFSVLLLMSHILQSVMSKRKEIGILRAMGAAKFDVLAIFLHEALFLVMLVLMLTIPGSIGVMAGINGIMPERFLLDVSVVHYGIRQFGIQVGCAIGAALAACVIPVIAIARKKPAEAIRTP